MRTFIENYLHFMKNCIRPHYEKLKPLKSGFIENSNFENDRDPWEEAVEMWQTLWQREKVELEGDELFLERERLAKLAIDAEKDEGN